MARGKKKSAPAPHPSPVHAPAYARVAVPSPASAPAPVPLPAAFRPARMDDDTSVDDDSVRSQRSDEIDLVMKIFEKTMDAVKKEQAETAKRMETIQMAFKATVKAVAGAHGEEIE